MLKLTVTADLKTLKLSGYDRQDLSYIPSFPHLEQLELRDCVVSCSTGAVQQRA